MVWSFVKRYYHLLPLQNSACRVAGGLGQDSSRNQPLLMRKTLPQGHKNKTVLLPKDRWGRRGVPMAVNALPSSCSGWIPARLYLFIGFAVKLLFDKRSHCTERMSRATGYCVHSQLCFLRPWALVFPESRHSWPGRAINLLLWAWKVRARERPFPKFRQHKEECSEPWRPWEAGQLTFGPDSWPWAIPFSPQGFCFPIYNTRASWMLSQGPSNSALILFCEKV